MDDNLCNGLEVDNNLMQSKRRNEGHCYSNVVSWVEEEKEESTVEGKEEKGVHAMHALPSKSKGFK